MAKKQQRQPHRVLTTPVFGGSPWTAWVPVPGRLIGIIANLDTPGGVLTVYSRGGAADVTPQIADPALNVAPVAAGQYYFPLRQPYNQHNVEFVVNVGTNQSNATVSFVYV